VCGLISRKLSKIDSLELGIADLFRSLGEILTFQVQNMCKYLYNVLFDLASDHSCCKPSMTIVLLPVLSSVVNRL